MKYFLPLMALFLSSTLDTYAKADIHEKTFTDIYERAIWGTNNRGEGFSGGGSLLENCHEYISLLQRLLKDLNIKTVVDAGCGDWEFSRYVDWSGIDYKGYDVVDFIIEKDKKRFSAPNIQFFHANFLKEELPAADLCLCKHVLQHLSNRDILNFLPKLKQFKYCLITNEVYPSTLTSDNPDIPVGSGRKVDLTKPPFNTPGTKLLNYRVGNSVHQVFLIDNTHSTY